MLKWMFTNACVLLMHTFISKACYQLSPEHLSASQPWRIWNRMPLWGLWGSNSGWTPTMHNIRHKFKQTKKQRFRELLRRDWSANKSSELGSELSESCCSAMSMSSEVAENAWIVENLVGESIVNLQRFHICSHPWLWHAISHSYTCVVHFVYDVHDSSCCSKWSHLLHMSYSMWSALLVVPCQFCDTQFNGIASMGSIIRDRFTLWIQLVHAGSVCIMFVNPWNMSWYRSVTLLCISNWNCKLSLAWCVCIFRPCFPTSVVVKP